MLAMHALCPVAPPPPSIVLTSCATLIVSGDIPLEEPPYGYRYLAPERKPARRRARRRGRRDRLAGWRPWRRFAVVNWASRSMCSVAVVSRSTLDAVQVLFEADWCAVDSVWVSVQVCEWERECLSEKVGLSDDGAGCFGTWR